MIALAALGLKVAGKALKSPAMKNAFGKAGNAIGNFVRKQAFAKAGGALGTPSGAKLADLSPEQQAEVHDLRSGAVTGLANMAKGLPADVEETLTQNVINNAANGNKAAISMSMDAIQAKIKVFLSKPVNVVMAVVGAGAVAWGVWKAFFSKPSPKGKFKF